MDADPFSKMKYQCSVNPWLKRNTPASGKALAGGMKLHS